MQYVIETLNIILRESTMLINSQRHYMSETNSAVSFHQVSM
jgi:hypothetical protein